MTQQIKFSKETNFTGRNGYFICSGIELMTLDHNREIMISPLTSRGTVGRCDISIPKDDIPKLIESLQQIVKQ